MAKRKIIIDRNILVSIKRGNERAAEILCHLIETHDVYYEGQVWMESNSEADKRLLTDSGMKRAPRLDMGHQGVLEDRVAIYEKNNMYTRISHQDLMIAATAMAMDAELLSVDEPFREAFRKSGGKVAPESRSLGSPKSPIPSHMEGRRLMRLPALNISKEGKILPKPAPPPGPPPKVVPTGGSGGGGSSPPPTQGGGSSSAAHNSQRDTCETRLRIGYFGSSTGGAAALIASVERLEKFCRFHRR